MQIEVVPQPGAPDPKDVNSRLYRTCISLLETIHRYGWGFATNYQKQVFHDCVVSREEYQDLYLVLRERHKHLVGQWHENTDPLKHVYEVSGQISHSFTSDHPQDIGIATFLMLIWRQGAFAGGSGVAKSVTKDKESDRPEWYDWPRPLSFLDFGCATLTLHPPITDE